MKTTIDTDDIHPEYDFSNAVRGKHFRAYTENTNVILLEEDVAKVFKSSESVNKTLRMLMNIANERGDNNFAN